MSQNDQTLVQTHKGKWYVFTNIMAESWINEDGVTNDLLLSDAVGVFDNVDDACEYAIELEEAPKGETEYGVVLNHLYKDASAVTIIE